MTTRRTFLSAAAGAVPAVRAWAAGNGLNVLLITADDMNYDSPSFMGGRPRGITPNIDKLASEGLRFAKAHVTVAVCQPSRSVLMTGRYPYQNGAEGFNPIRTNIPTLQESLHAAGYMQGILAKNEHLAPRAKFCWDTYITPAELGRGRDPQLYYKHTREFLAKAKAARQPFFLMANSQDPHRPFAGSEQEMQNFGDHVPVRRTVRPEEVDVPKFLPDIENVRREVAQYFTSVYRCDETVGQVLRALEEGGAASNTLVMFLSDNGMSFPFSKTNCYLQSTRTPWMARWPGKVKPGVVNQGDFISGIDYTPTILDAAGLEPIAGVAGRSFVPLLRGESQPGRDHVFTVFHETSAKQRFEMRCMQTARYGYIFNAWSDGKRIFRNESQNGLSFKAMQAAAANSPEIAARVKTFQYRTPEEFYDLEADPNGLKNLAGDPNVAAPMRETRARLWRHMKESGDFLASAKMPSS
jgi:N-sulfoglucosamine sulfohydrolase